MRIDNLIEHPHAVAELARWHFDEWCHLYPEQGLDDFTEDLQRSLQGGPLPATWVLVDNGRIWGSASVLERDMVTNLHLRPWLASVYVHPQQRGRGGGRALVSAVTAACRERGLTELYLFTPGQEQFYQSLGWTLLKRETYRGEEVAIMNQRLQD
ncbi:GNAT family N-acetyltransferase [Microbulbifer sp. SAOS-129_SWC]|uniref:GNAT family N-acetyltransferase n=1 Tax=Microbulbifer sp. SAOS-129_SWC TaxID=3145235 RepID=UPI0032170BC3